MEEGVDQVALHKRRMAVAELCAVAQKVVNCIELSVGELLKSEYCESSAGALQVVDAHKYASVPAVLQACSLPHLQGSSASILWAVQ